MARHIRIVAFVSSLHSEDAVAFELPPVEAFVDLLRNVGICAVRPLWRFTGMWTSVRTSGRRGNPAYSGRSGEGLGAREIP